MAEQRLLVVKLGSLGDIIFTLPAVAALRQAFPEAQLDWVVERRWQPLLAANPDVSTVLVPQQDGPGRLLELAARVRARRYQIVVDFQGLYKSALLTWWSRAPRRVGFVGQFAREPAASLFYTDRVRPRGRHMVEQNLELARALGAPEVPRRFPLVVPVEAEQRLAARLASAGLRDYFVMSPGGGWRSKCWPPERYGQLHRILAQRWGWRGVVNFGPGERALAEAVCRAAGDPPPLLLELNLEELMALLRRARLMIAGDTGPLHLAVALGTPVVGLYGPTPPERNGPFNPADVVVRNAGPEETTLRRGRHYSRAMLSITVEQVVEAVERRLGGLR
jgi:lipopolysaccharide heptosyltransferase I